MSDHHTTPAAMSSALAAAHRRVERVFAGRTAKPGGCGRCYFPEELALLTVPRAPMSDDLVRMMFHETPDHFADHPGVIRRLLPQFLAYAAEGRFEGAGYLPTGLGRTGWQAWPREEAEAVDGFLSVWWAEALASPTPASGLRTVYELCADMRQSVTPMLDHWAAHLGEEVPRRHLVAWLDEGVDDLLQDDASSWTSSWAPDPLAEVQDWLLRHASRLDARVPLLALPPEERWIAYAETVAAADSASAADTS
ncbi:hypothetical protein KV205_18770 [Streptomyces sp. SKN60]|uniref:hypothetical protein n=1 Tax=Streptomyces sp. SKN60 TaxID=2855506 RepID=UPI002246BBA0|nr:hypothetical protein [Streptomyces sp. SKN60]MCX2182554.1 hypothetical protein [Streptomyces sp. SKN60]